jgi:hypothetical protein
MSNLEHRRDWSRLSWLGAPPRRRPASGKWTRADVDAVVVMAALILFVLVLLGLRYWRFMPATFSLSL